MWSHMILCNNTILGFLICNFLLWTLLRTLSQVIIVNSDHNEIMISVHYGCMFQASFQECIGTLEHAVQA